MRGESSAEVAVSGDQVEPFPIPAAAPSSTLAAYRYDPSIDASSPHAATLRVGRVNPRQAAPTALVWQARTQSYLQPGSVVSHCSLLRVENHGQPFLEVTFPADAIVRQVEIDNQPLTLRLDTEGRLQVALPSDRRFVLVCVHFSSPQHGSSLFTAIDRPEIKVNAPLLDSSWTVFARSSISAEMSRATPRRIKYSPQPVAETPQVSLLA